ncbi:MAG: 23S rRNA (pseudouridine(1915)-N(3))-methyltransferase RlmH [Crocinitomicaceae bacterium]|nr:23S rRNA (pseudouridine(1915)-N(3))-methyltransferase RlmH [Crocinitomicaceae bacterium]MBK8926146.1 23S rRNA (pseudouridine(1915)-N(3))-methyltransferase RlmH [Crocinitomicaceae bacterium]
MKFRLLTVGKTNKPYFTETEQEYGKRLAKYIIFEKIELSDVRNAKNLTADQIKKEEGKLILSKLEKSGLVVLLDEGGKEMSSPQFSSWIRDEMNRGHKSITFVIGGAYGFSEEVYAAAAMKLSLSRMTFNHQMVRGFFIEQLYRAFTILRGEPYHHG